MDRQELMNGLSSLWEESIISGSEFAPWSFAIDAPGEEKRRLTIGEKWASEAEVEDVLLLAEGLPPGEHLITSEGRLHTISSKVLS